MKLPPVDYEAPGTVTDAVELLAEHEDDANVLAGGQSLIPLLALRLARPAVLVDLNGIDELSGITADDGWTVIGAMTREHMAEESPRVAQAVPLLAAALPFIGHVAIRSRGTIGGSLAHADPAAELPAVACALDAELVVRGPRASGSSRRPTSSRATSRPRGSPTRCSRGCASRRRRRARASASGGGPAPRRLRHGRRGHRADAGRRRHRRRPAGLRRAGRHPGAGQRRGGPADRRAAVGELFDEAARRATATCSPPADLHGSSAYRQTVAAVLVRRGLQAAAGDARERQ